MVELTESAKRKLWRKVLGYQIGEKITLRYLPPDKYRKRRMGIPKILIRGTIVEIYPNTIVIETKDGLRIHLSERLCDEAKR